MDLQEMCMVPPGITNNENTEQEKSRPRRSKQLSCPHCNRTFNHRNSLLYHIRSHSGQRPHQCEVCGKSFFAASALKVGNISKPFIHFYTSSFNVYYYCTCSSLTRNVSVSVIICCCIWNGSYIKCSY